MDRIVSVFSFDGRLDELKKNSKLTYHGPAYKGVAPPKSVFDEVVKFEQIGIIIRDNWELGRSSNHQGILITRDFEGSVWITDEGLAYGMNYLQRNAIDNLLRIVDKLTPEKIIDRIDIILKDIRLSEYYTFQLKVLKANQLTLLGKFESSNRLLVTLLQYYQQMSQASRSKTKHSLTKHGVEYNDTLNFDKGSLFLLLGVNTRFLLDPEQAKSHFVNAIREWKKTNYFRTTDLVNAYTNLGTIEIQKNNLEEAYEYFEQALQTSRELGQTNQILHLLNLANIHKRLDQFDLALDTVNQAEKLSDLDKNDLLKIYEMKASILLHSDIKKSQVMYQKSLDYAYKHNQHYSQIASMLYHLIIIGIITNDLNNTKPLFDKLVKLNTGREDILVKEMIEFLRAILSLFGVLEHQNPEDILIKFIEDQNTTVEIRIQSALFLLRAIFSPQIDVLSKDNPKRETVFSLILNIGHKFKNQPLIDLINKHQATDKLDLAMIENLIIEQSVFSRVTI